MITPLRCSGMAHVLKGSHSFTCTPRIHLLTLWTIPVFAFPAKAGTHYRPRRDGRLSWMIHTTVAVINSYYCNILQIPVNTVPLLSLPSAAVFHHTSCPGNGRDRVTIGTVLKYTFTRIQEHPDSLNMSPSSITSCQAYNDSQDQCQLNPFSGLATIHFQQPIDN